MSVARAETKYARSGDVFIAYQVVGQGPTDLIHSPGAVSHLEHDWEEPSFARYLTRLASFFRVILFDKRGTGLSDRVVGIASLDERIDDIRAVMDASGSERAALMGLSEGASMSALFAATYPKRVSVSGAQPAGGSGVCAVVRDAHAPGVESRRSNCPDADE